MIACRQVVAGYGARPVLRDVSLAARGGECVAVLGPNGGGKTTLLRVLSGVLPRREGQVLLGGAALEELPHKERARRVAVVSQRVDALPPVSVRDMVLLGRYPYLSWFGVYSADDYAAADAALRAAGATDLAMRPVRELSGGEAQRVLLARALAQQTPTLLLDEPSTGLDMARMVEIFNVLEQRRMAGACVVAVMHDINLAALYATRMVGIKRGKVLFDGPVNQVFTEDTLRKLYDIPIHVFRHPVLPVPQACPGRAPGGAADLPLAPDGRGRDDGFR